MKVKVFSGMNFRELEDRINKFIKDKCVININTETTSCEVCGSIWSVLIVIVLYDEINHCGYLDAKSLVNFEKYKL